MISKTKIKTKCKTPIEQIKSVDTITSRIPININSYTKDKLTLDIEHANKTIDKMTKSILNHEIELKEKEQKLQDIKNDLSNWIELLKFVP